MLLMPAEQLAHSPAPFADVVGVSWGEAAAMLVAVGIAISAFGCVGCNTMAGGELCYSMALKGDVPQALARTNRHGAPALSQAVTVALSVILVMSNASRSTAGLFTFILLVSTVAVLVLYTVAALAAAVRERSPSMTTMVLAGVLFCAYAFYGSGLEASLWGLGLALAGLPVRAMARWLSGSSRVAEAIPAAPPGSSS
jgi:APA family basic amino acid/polyamine antiporter